MVEDFLQRFFQFAPPSSVIPNLSADLDNQLSFLQVSSDTVNLDTTPNPYRGSTGGERFLNQPNAEPAIKYSSNAKHVLAYIIRTLRDHFMGARCRALSRGLDGFKGAVMRRNSKAAILEYFIAFALLRGNTYSASKYSNEVNTLFNAEGDTPVERLQQAQVPGKVTNEDGIYDPALILELWTLSESTCAIMKF